MPDLSVTQTKSFWQRQRFWLLLLAAVVLRQLPLLSLPFNWLESYFHEISHGLTAVLTGGEIVRIQLFTNGAGLCTSRGGSAFLISFFGYAGAIIWGAMIYLIASVHHRLAHGFALTVIALLLLSMLFWVRDLLTLFICIVLLVMFALMLKNNVLRYIQLLVQLLGMIVLLNALFSPLYLLDGRALGDGANLANLTGLPEIIWVTLWSSMAVAAIYLLGKRS